MRFYHGEAEPRIYVTKKDFLDSKAKRRKEGREEKGAGPGRAGLGRGGEGGSGSARGGVVDNRLAGWPCDDVATRGVGVGGILHSSEPLPFHPFPSFLKSPRQWEKGFYMDE